MMELKQVTSILFGPNTMTQTLNAKKRSFRPIRQMCDGIEQMTSILFGSNTMTKTLIECQTGIISAYQPNMVDAISCWKMAINP